MIEEQKLTGYPSMDKPWLKYYKNSAINISVPECSIYAYLYQCNKNHLTDYAINYFGKRITYGQLFIEIKNTAKKLLSIGVCSGDVVTILLSNTPETIYIIYALNIIGAIGSLQYLTATVETVENEIASTKSNTVIILDTFYNTYKTAIKNVDNIILVSPSHSLPLIKKLFYKVKVNSVKESGTVYFSKLRICQEIINHKFVKNTTAIMLHSGGTTGIPKMVKLTNENINSIAAQYSVNGMEYNRGESFMHTFKIGVNELIHKI